MKQSRDAEEIMKLQDLTGKLQEAGVIQVTTAPSGPYSSGPGAPAKEYSKDQIIQMLDYTKSYIKKGADANWLNKFGVGMEEFLKLRKGDPALDYKESDMGDDAHDKPYGALSQGKAAKASASAEMRGKSTGSFRKDSPESDELTDIGKKEQSIGQNKSAKGSKVTHSTEA
jgi:hypothetical protein